MNKKRAQLAERRQQLVAQAAVQRISLAHDLEPWRARLVLADRGIAGLRYIKSHPILMVGAVLLLAALRQGRVGKWLQRGWVVWQLGRRLGRR
jgi:YqjK-like protein